MKVLTARGFAAKALAVALLVPAATRGQWLEEPGQGWIDLTLYHQDTREAYGVDGVAGPFFADGRAVSTSVFLTVAGGIVPGLDAWVQVPYHRLRYDDLQDDRLRTGIGDTRFFLRTAPLRYLGVYFPFAVRVGVKVPVSDFTVDSEIIPLGDGQRDFEVMVEAGHSFFPFPGYVSGWVGYRWRETNNKTFRDFGDEGFFLAQGGVTSGMWSFKLIAEGGGTVTDPIVAGLPISSAKRRLFSLAPAVGLAVGPGAASLGVRFSLAGQNLPAGTALVLGYFSRWAL